MSSTRTPSGVPSNRFGTGARLSGAILAGILATPAAIAMDPEKMQWSGHVGGEYRYFTDAGAGGARYQHNVSLVAEPELYYPVRASGDSLRLTAFLRLDEHDDERSHGDIREMKWHKVADRWELTLGVDRIFWGVTETIHLVNIINQQDFVENPDGEDLLGQPMIRLDLVRDWGTLGLFVLPYFRERSYPGTEGRPGSALVVDTDNPVYESGTEQWHTDFALRWSHYIGNWDLGASYFYGTSREPRFDPMFSSITKQGVTTLRPVYDIIHQAGVDVQGTFDAWLWKLEAIYRDGQDDAFFAGAVGLEYTFFDISGYGIDIGLVTEYLYDERNFFISTDNDLSLGMRLTLNDIDSTEFLAAVVQDLDNQSRYFFVEASRRIGDSFKLSVEARGINNVAEGDPLQFYDGDNFVQVELAYYF